MSTSSPRLSYVIPVHNGVSLIGRCIDSILGQPGSMPEVVVVDDGSTDGTLDVIANYGSTIRIVTQENSGPAAARNHGLAHTTGDLVCFVDHDDYVIGPHRTVMEREWRINYDLLIGLEANHREKLIWLTSQNKYEDVLDAGGMLAEFIRDNCVQTSTIVWSNRYIRAIGGWDEAMWGIDDIELAMRAFLLGANIGKSRELAWVVWSHTPGSLSSRLTKRIAASHVLAFRKQLALMEDGSPYVYLRPKLFSRGAAIARQLHLNGFTAEGDEMLAELEAKGSSAVSGPLPEALLCRLFGTGRILRMRHVLGNIKRSLRKARTEA